MTEGGGEHCARAVHVQMFCTCSSFAAPTGQTVRAANAKLPGNMYASPAYMLLWLPYTRSIMNVSRALFTHSRQNGTLAESRSEEGSLTGSSAQPDTWRIPHSSPPFQPGTHTDRAITARGEGPQPAVFRPICCVSVRGRDRRGGGGELSKDLLPIEPELRSKNERVAHSPRDNAVDN